MAFAPADTCANPHQVAAELQQFLGSSQIPSFAPHAQKLQNVRRRIAATNATLQQVQARLTRLDRIAERLQAQEHHSLRPAPAAGAPTNLGPSVDLEPYQPAAG
jgi:hypothetical protein